MLHVHVYNICLLYFKHNVSLKSYYVWDAQEAIHKSKVKRENRLVVSQGPHLQCLVATLLVSKVASCPNNNNVYLIYTRMCYNTCTNIDLII